MKVGKAHLMEVQNSKRKLFSVMTLSRLPFIQPLPLFCFAAQYVKLRVKSAREEYVTLLFSNF